ncbi:MAG: GerMN domain-containing protein [Gemmatimonadota bacterium]
MRPRTPSLIGCLSCALLLPAGCGERSGAPASGESADSVTVVFTREEEPVPVRRPVPSGSSGVQSALEWLLRGPNEDEVARGIESWFSGETAASLRAISIDPSGRAVVDFHDLQALLPGASSSTGSTLLLQELNGTLFGFPEVQSVEYRMDGSCDRFWEWLQYACHIVERPGAGR